MLFMNMYEIEEAVQRYGGQDSAMGRAVRFLDVFSSEVNYNSDGWSSWPLPVRAASQLMKLIQSGSATQAQYLKALAPIKSFYTRRGYAAGMKMPIHARDAQAVNAMRTMNNAQLHLINSRSNGSFFDGTVREYRDYTDACNLLHEGKMVAKSVISRLTEVPNV
jgi:hypothetical protein